MSEKTLLEVEGLKKYFQVGKGQTLKAVDDISFQIKKGQTLGLVGESGCGKTTVGRTLLRIYEPEAGKILFDGKDISQGADQENADGVPGSICVPESIFYSWRDRRRGNEDPQDVP